LVAGCHQPQTCPLGVLLLAGFVSSFGAPDGAKSLPAKRPLAVRAVMLFPLTRRKNKKTILAHQGKFPRVAATESVTAAPGEISAPAFAPGGGSARETSAGGGSFWLFWLSCLLAPRRGAHIACNV